MYVFVMFAMPRNETPVGSIYVLIMVVLVRLRMKHTTIQSYKIGFWLIRKRIFDRINPV